MPDSVYADIENARRFLDGQFMKADNDWLQGCVEFFRNDSGRNFNTNQLNNAVRDQWMLCDLREMSPGSLPSSLNDQIKVMLIGSHVLQMNYLLNIATPAYQQLQKIQKVDMTNVETTAFENDRTYRANETNNRMLKLFLTDGVQDICGIEYRPMRNLDCNLIPGVKILIKGPIQCRRGALMLEEKHVTVLGGEVDSLVGVNNFENILARTIGLAEDADRREIPAVAQFTREAHNPPIEPLNDLQSIPEMDELNENDFADDDIDIDQLAALENQILSNVTAKTDHNPPKPKPAQPQAVPAATIPNFEWNPPVDVITSPTMIQSVSVDVSTPPMPEQPFKYNNMRQTSINSFANPAKKQKIDNTTDLQMDDFAADDFMDSFEEPSRPSTSTRTQTFTIAQLSRLPLSEKANNVYIIKAKLKCILKKLQLIKNDWDLKCTLEDNTGSLDVHFCSDILSDLIGFSPVEMNKIKKEMSVRTDLKERVLAGLERTKNHLKNMHSHIEISFENGPRVVKIID